MLYKQNPWYPRGMQYSLVATNYVIYNYVIYNYVIYNYVIYNYVFLQLCVLQLSDLQLCDLQLRVQHTTRQCMVSYIHDIRYSL